MIATTQLPCHYITTHPSHACHHACFTHPVLAYMLLHTQQRHGDNNNTMIALALLSPLFHLTLISFLALDCYAHSSNVVTMATWWLQPHNHCIVIANAICNAHICPYSILGNYLMLVYLISNMEISLTICFFCFASASFLYLRGSNLTFLLAVTSEDTPCPVSS